MKKLIACLVIVVLIAGMFSACAKTSQETTQTDAETVDAAAEEVVVDEPVSNYPERPITLIVPFSAGGGTDGWNRAIAAAMEEGGWTVKVANLTGGSAGSVGTAQVWLSQHDGYTLAGTSETPLTIPVMTGDPQTTKDWEYYIAGGSPGILCVNKQSGITDLQGLLDACAADPGKIKVAGTSGGLWFLLASMLEYGGGIDLGVATYDGSAAARDACVKNETAALVASAGEVAEFVKSGDLIPIANFATEDFTHADFGTVPAITSLVPEVEKYLPLNQFIGFMVPNDTPEDVKATLEEAFLAACDTQILKDFADQNYAVFYKWVGEEADENCAAVQATMCWMLYEMGKTEFSPEDFGIPKP